MIEEGLCEWGVQRDVVEWVHDVCGRGHDDKLRLTIGVQDGEPRADGDLRVPRRWAAARRLTHPP